MVVFVTVVDIKSGRTEELKLKTPAVLFCGALSLYQMNYRQMKSTTL